MVTTNQNKAKEVAAFFGPLLEVDHVALECPEFRHDDVGVIAEQKANFAWDAVRRPLIVDDTGFSVHALSGFPGPYAAYVFDTLGNDGILKLLRGVADRSAHFETAVAFADKGGVRVFRGQIDGTIVEARGEGGFGYDPIFEVAGRTLAEISLQEKSAISHRALALARFRDWLAGESGLL